MARNKAFDLDAAQCTLEANVLIMLAAADASTDILTVEYVKRDGSTGTASGSFIGMSGVEGTSTSSFKLDTERGPRTVNTWLVRDMHVSHECGSTTDMPGLAALAAWAGVGA